MSKKPNVSVVIPAYNAETVLGEALEGILRQSYEDYEVIIIDDQSSDGTYALAKEFSKKDKRIKVYRNENNLGVGATRSRGILLAEGDYICWQDADDISLNDRIKLQVEYLDTHPNTGVVGGFIEFFDEINDGPVRRYSEADKDLRRSIFRYNPIAQPASMFRRECFREVGLYDPFYKVSEDLEMLFRVGTRYEFGNVQKVVLRYRQSSTSLTRANLRKMEEATLRLRRMYAHHPAYHFGFADACFNAVQRITIFMPVDLRMKVFKLLRGDK